MLTLSTSCKLALLSTPRIFCASSSVIPLAFAAAFTLSGVTPDFCASARGTHTKVHCPGRPELHSLATHAEGPAAGRTDKSLPIRLGASTQQHARARHYQVCQDAGGLQGETRSLVRAQEGSTGPYDSVCIVSGKLQAAQAHHVWLRRRGRSCSTTFFALQ